MSGLTVVQTPLMVPISSSSKLIKNYNRATQISGIVLVLLHRYCQSQKSLGQHMNAWMASLITVFIFFMMCHEADLKVKQNYLS